MRYVDLHLHSNYSDGADPPKDVVVRAQELGVAAIALTDHDTIGGIGEARRVAVQLGLGFLCGVEISADFQGQETHVLAYGFDANTQTIAELLRRNLAARQARSREILARLGELGIVLDGGYFGDLDGGAPGRMHIAVALRDKGVTKTVQEGFDRYLRFGRPAYVPRKNVEVCEALKAVQDAGGLSFLAHPGLNKGLRKRMPALLELPFDGIEAYHSSHSPGDVEGFLQLAKDRGLLVSGGSDCHGGMKGGKPEMGNVQTPYPHYEAIMERLAR